MSLAFQPSCLWSKVCLHQPRSVKPLHDWRLSGIRLFEDGLKLQKLTHHPGPGKIKESLEKLNHGVLPTSF
jgi:hypothetical protein